MEEKNRPDGAYVQWLSMDDARAYAGGISRSTLQRLLKKRIVRGTRVGTRTLVFRSSLDEYLLSREYDPRANPVRE